MNMMRLPLWQYSQRALNQWLDDYIFNHTDCARPYQWYQVDYSQDQMSMNTND